MIYPILISKSRIILGIAVAVLFQSQYATAQFTVPIYNWDFTQSTTDTVNGVTATLANPAGLGPHGYTFTGVGEGITILQPASIAVTGTYAIELVFSLDTNTGDYQRIIDFWNFTSDEGLYVYDDYFYFYDYDDTDVDLDNVPFMQDMTVRITRDAATKVVTLTLDGQFVWSFVDEFNYSVFDQPDNIMHFFEDDSGEHPAGIVKSIRVCTAPPAAAELSVNKLRPFPGTLVGKSSRAQTLTFTNTGEGPLTDLSVKRSGKHPGEFRLTRLSASTLAPNASATVKVIFNPRSPGRRRAVLQVTSNTDRVGIPVNGRALAGGPSQGSRLPSQ
jgi:hypothetical protein